MDPSCSRKVRFETVIKGRGRGGVRPSGTWDKEPPIVTKSHTKESDSTDPLTHLI